MLVAFGDPPLDIAVMQIPHIEDLMTVEVKLAEKQFTALSKKDIPCGNYDTGETFSQCTQRYFTQQLKGRCSLPGS